MDTIDRQILRSLQTDGSLSVAALAAAGRHFDGFVLAARPIARGGRAYWDAPCGWWMRARFTAA